MSKSKLIIEGLNGVRGLSGEIAVAGAKNAITKIFPATILFEDEVRITNVPAIEDAARMTELVQAAGGRVEREGSNATVFQAANWNPVLDKKIAERLRASIVFTGPLLARTGRVEFPFPGGCVLGERSIDLFLMGFKTMGAVVEEDDSYFRIHTSGKLKGARITFPFISVTATETLMMAATLAEGETILENAALEPEIADMAFYLNECGARIEGAGTSTIKITGGQLLHAGGITFDTPPDRIETGSFVMLAALAGSDVLVSHCNPSWLTTPLSLLRKAGVPLEIGKDYIRVQAAGVTAPYKMFSVRTHEYPGFSTDLQAPTAAFLSQCEGEGNILETIFDGRFRYVDDLVRMGADMSVMNPHRILIKGPRKLTAKNMESPDLRGGLAYLIAASVAEGTSTINNAYLIDRGYERIEERLAALGLNIKREEI
ncbi:UDP-N-acetylglucosamine 1-carboxyvinyltransferase [Candidatus Kaiserbacteria bacterium]|nr:UDP-N-acetylglucosamine 1-carboxyvinyltransferase [Candidatus Kaiserbacteria bacterium]